MGFLDFGCKYGTYVANQTMHTDKIVHWYGTYKVRFKSNTLLTN